MYFKIKALIILLVLIIIGCGKIEIRDIRNNPEKYNGEEVTIEGYVRGIMKVPKKDIYFFELDDETSQIWVISKGKEIKPDEKVKVKGKISLNVSIAGTSFSIILVPTEDIIIEENKVME